MNNWTFLSDTLNQLVQLIQSGGTPLLNATVDYARPLVIAAAIAWIGVQAIAVAYDHASSKTLLHGLFRIAVVVAVLQTVGTYNQWVGDVAQAFPNEIVNMLSHGTTGDITAGHAFDNILNDAVKAGLTAWEHTSKYSLTVIVIGLGILGFIIVAIMSIGAALLTYAMSTIALIFFIKIGPLFLALFAFPQTRRFGSGWITAIVSAALTQIFTVAMLVLLMAAEQQTLDKIVTKTTTGADPNVITELYSLMLAGFLFYVIWTLTKQAASFASSIAGGVHQQVNHLQNAIGGLASYAAKGVGTVVSSAAGAGASAARATAASAIKASRVNKMIN